jgi:hypothetical protein
MTTTQLRALAASFTPEQLAAFAAAVNAGTLKSGLPIPSAAPVAAPKRTRKRPSGIATAKLVKAIAYASKAKGGCVRALGGSIAKRDHANVCKSLGLAVNAANSARVNEALALLVKAGGAWSHVDAKLRLHVAKSAKTTAAHAEAFIARATKRVNKHLAG